MALRVGVVGLGVRGREWAATVREAPGWELAACVDRDRAALDTACGELEVAPAARFDDLAQALDLGLDAVVVATPLDAHERPTRAALEARTAVLVEKPFARSLAAATELVELAEAQEAPLVVGQNHRYLRGQRAARRLVQAGRLGAVRLVVCQYYRAKELPGIDAVEDALVWEHCVHQVDGFRHMLGQEIVGVSADLDKHSAHVILDCSGGTRIAYTAALRSRGHEFFEHGQEFYERFVGDRATLHVVYRWLVLCETGRLPRWVRRGRRLVTEEVVLLNQLRAAIEHGAEPDASGRDNLRTVATLEAIVQSAREHRRVDPRELVPHG
jgi:predicted dehydrogenase